MRRNHTLQTLDQIMKACNDMNLPSDKRVINHYAKCIEEMADDAIEKIKHLLEKPEIRSCRIPLIVDFDTMTNAYYWLSCKIFSIIPKEQGRAVKEKLISMADLLKALELKMKKVNPAFAEAIIKRMMSMSQKRIHVTDYDIWKAEHPDATPDMLLNYQIQLTTKVLIERVLAHDRNPNGKELKEVRVDLVKEGLEDGTELPDDFANECAKLRRYSYWIGSYQFMIDYQKIYRSQFINNFDKLTKKQRMLLFEYDVQMRQIHEDLERMLNGNTANNKERKYEFAIVNSLSRMINTDWFYSARTDKKYDGEWVKNFLNDMIASSLGSKIDEEWERANKRPFLKAAIIGGLYEAGVIKGSKLSIAKAVINGSLSENKNFGVYMYKAKKEGYCDWVCEYVNH